MRCDEERLAGCRVFFNATSLGAQWGGIGEMNDGGDGGESGIGYRGR